jgi:uncharacterized protein (TIGR02996 family)
MDEPTFFRAIRDQHNDDSPWLVYADWLEEQGETERAELIRLRCELANMPLGEGRRAHRTRADRLQQRYRSRFQQQFPWVLHFHDGHGVAEQIVANAADFVAGGDALFRAAPVWSVTLTEVRAQTEALAESTALSEVRSLVVASPGANPVDISNLMRSANLAALRSLDLSHVVLGDAGAEAIAGSRHLQHLTTLFLPNTGTGNAGAMALAGSATLSALESIDLSYNDLTERGVRALAQSRHLAHVRAVNLTGNRLGQSTIAWLMRAGGGRFRW